MDFTIPTTDNWQEQLEYIATKEGFNFTQDEDGNITLQKFSPRQQDFTIELIKPLDYRDALDDLNAQLASYNVNDEAMMWYRDGQLRFRSTYKDGALDGVFEYWHDNGQLAGRCSYRAGKLEGISEEWHDNGQLSEFCIYKDDKLDGLYKSWFPNGLLERECVYKYGRICEPQPKITIPTSPVQEQAQAILDARGERNDNTLKDAQEEQEERKSQSHKL